VGKLIRFLEKWWIICLDHLGLCWRKENGSMELNWSLIGMQMWICNAMDRNVLELEVDFLSFINIYSGHLVTEWNRVRECLKLNEDRIQSDEFELMLLLHLSWLVLNFNDFYFSEWEYKLSYSYHRFRLMMSKCVSLSDDQLLLQFYWSIIIFRISCFLVANSAWLKGFGVHLM
jgi:hypothetical protein